MSHSYLIITSLALLIASTGEVCTVKAVGVDASTLFSSFMGSFFILVFELYRSNSSRQGHISTRSTRDAEMSVNLLGRG